MTTKKGQTQQQDDTSTAAAAAATDETAETAETATSASDPTIELGKVAYGASCAASKGRSLVSGQSLPTWEDQSLNIQAAWVAAAQAVVDHLSK